MDFDLQWLLIGLPIAFAFGWIASRLDIGQWRRAQREAPKAYFHGLNLLLNEQHDKAIDAFIEAVQRDPDTTELHFALGNLFRRRGEFERAVRVHQHLLHRADLSAADHARAQHALAQDFVKAGLLDRAEEAYRELEGTSYDIEARLARLALAERARDWRTAAQMAQRLEASGTGSYATRLAHHWCELSLQAADAGDDEADDDALKRAREAAPHAPRPLILAARRAAQRGDAAAAFGLYTELLQHAPALFPLIASDYATAAIQSGQAEAARATVARRMKEQPSVDLLQALRLLDGAAPAEAGLPDAGERAQGLLHVQPTLSAALAVLDAPLDVNDESALRDVREAVARAARSQQRYRCAACGFEAPQHFWQCPGCLNWDTFPAQRIEEL
ncbi:MAG TPA: lipopolysaccharide assembly protein LapB [Burkholderiaceae bacterium]|nr:lipopolysaccharide assembly protein LapB [Burkholderiaceae bacterium]